MDEHAKESKVAAEDYYGAAFGWEVDREARRERSERRAWLVATIALVIAITAVAGIATLAPYRRNIPYLFEVDRVTGNVEFVGAIDERRILSYQELLDKHWAQRYVVARESYNYRLLQADYDTVLGMSNDTVGRDFARLYEGSEARDAKFGARVEIKATVLSVQLSQNAAGSQAVVRFSKQVRRPESDFTDTPQYFVATIAYAYKPTMAGKEKELLANPLGFRVSSYRVDSEITPVTPPAVRSAS